MINKVFFTGIKHEDFESAVNVLCDCYNLHNKNSCIKFYTKFYIDRSQFNLYFYKNGGKNLFCKMNILIFMNGWMKKVLDIS